MFKMQIKTQTGNRRKREHVALDKKMLSLKIGFEVSKPLNSTFFAR